MGEPAVPASSGGLEDEMGNVVFEAGQRLRIRGSNVELVLVERDTKYGISPVWDAGDAGCWLEEHLAMAAELAAPVPRPHQRWECDTPYEVQIVDADGDLVVEDYYHGRALCRGAVVEVAKWLAGHGYKCVSEPRAASDDENLKISAAPQHGPLVVTLPELPVGNYVIKLSANGPAQEIRNADGRLIGYALDPTATDCTWTATVVGSPWREPNIRPLAALASAVADVFTPPTRDACRGYVDMAVRALRGEPFVKVIQATLISLVGDRISVFPTPNEIMATVDACHAWEHARGQVAPAKRTLSKAETRELTEVAKLAAWARVPMRDASDIGEIVAETYERARATC